ncbi:hypothetical protein G9A89_009024 [Geosiphon pyriformis]|nr:hypothetical protein G9A89_009024 [Geosiphon pyriformis]
MEGRNVEQIFQLFKQTKSNISPATITKDTTLTVIYSFDIDNLNTHSLFNGVAINQDKPIMALYTDARVGGIDIKLILDSGYVAYEHIAQQCEALSENYGTLFSNKHIVKNYRHIAQQCETMSEIMAHCSKITTPNTLTLLKTTAKHLQIPKQGTSSKFPLTITPFPASLAQAQTPNSPLNQFARPEDFTLLRSPIRQQKPIQTSSNLLDFLAENQSEHSETAANKENDFEITKKKSIDSENEKDEMTTYIAKIPEFNGEDIETSLQEWLDQVTKAGDANGWNAVRMLRTIPYFLKGTAGEWFENLATPFNDWNAFKAAFLEQFTDNNTSITLRNYKLIKKVRPHAPEDLNSAIQHAKRYEMAIEEANRTKLVNLAIGKTSSAAEKKIDQLTKKVENYFTNQQQQQPQRYQPLQRQNQNNFAPLSNNQPQNCHYCGISGH